MTPNHSVIAADPRRQQVRGVATGPMVEALEPRILLAADTIFAVDLAGAESDFSLAADADTLELLYRSVDPATLIDSFAMADLLAVEIEAADAGDETVLVDFSKGYWNSTVNLDDGAWLAVAGGAAVNNGADLEPVSVIEAHIEINEDAFKYGFEALVNLADLVNDSSELSTALPFTLDDVVYDEEGDVVYDEEGNPTYTSTFGDLLGLDVVLKNLADELFPLVLPPPPDPDLPPPDPEEPPHPNLDDLAANLLAWSMNVDGFNDTGHLIASVDPDSIVFDYENPGEDTEVPVIRFSIVTSSMSIVDMIGSVALEAHGVTVDEAASYAVSASATMTFVIALGADGITVREASTIVASVDEASIVLAGTELDHFNLGAANLSVSVGGGDAVEVAITAAENLVLEDLVVDIAAALDAAGLAGDVAVGSHDGALYLVALDANDSLTLTFEADDPAAGLGFKSDQVNNAMLTDGSGFVVGVLETMAVDGSGDLDLQALISVYLASDIAQIDLGVDGNGATVAAMGTIDGEVAVLAVEGAEIIVGLEAAETLELGLGGLDIFTEQPFGPRVGFDDGDLEGFANLTAEELLLSFESVQAWLDGMDQGEGFDVGLPLVEGTNVGDLVDFGGLFRAEFLDWIRELDDDNVRAVFGTTDLIEDGGTADLTMLSPGAFSFTISVDDGDVVFVGVYDPGKSVTEIVTVINARISATIYSGQVIAKIVNDQLSFALVPVDSVNELTLEVEESTPLITIFGFAKSQTAANTDPYLPTFTTLQEMVNELPDEFDLDWLTLTFNQAENRLEFGLDLTEDPETSMEDLPFRQNLELGALTDIRNDGGGDVADVTVTVQEVLNLDFAVDFDFVNPADAVALFGAIDLIPDDATADDVFLTPGAFSFTISVDDGDVVPVTVTVEVNIDGSQSVTNIVVAINEAIGKTSYAGAVTATLAGDRLAFLLSDEMAGASLTLTLVSVEGEDNSLDTVFGFAEEQTGQIANAYALVGGSTFLDPEPTFPVDDDNYDFKLQLGDVLVSVDVEAGVGDPLPLDGLVAHLNDAINLTDLAGDVIIDVFAGRMVFVLLGEAVNEPLTFFAAPDSALIDVFGFKNGQWGAFHEATAGLLTTTELITNVDLAWEDYNLLGQYRFVEFDLTSASAAGTMVLTGSPDDLDLVDDDFATLGYMDFDLSYLLDESTNQFEMTISGHASGYDDVLANQLVITAAMVDMSESLDPVEFIETPLGQILKITKLANVTVEAAAQELLDKLSYDDIVALLREALGTLEGIHASADFTEIIPILNISGADLNDFPSALGGLLVALEDEDVTSLQGMAAAIAELMGIDLDHVEYDPMTAGLTTPGVYFGLGADHLDVGLYLEHEESPGVDIAMDLSFVEHPDPDGTTENLIILLNDERLELTAFTRAVIDLDLMVNYSGEAPVYTLLGDGDGDSQVTISAALDEDELTFRALVGPGVAYVNGGSLSFVDSDGDAASYSVPLSTWDYQDSLVIDAAVYADFPFVAGESTSSVDLGNLGVEATHPFGSWELEVTDEEALGSLAGISNNPLSQIFEDPGLIVDGLDRFLQMIQTAIEAPFAALKHVPLLGDAIMDVVDPILEKISEARAALIGFLDEVFARINTTEDGEVITVEDRLKEVIYDLFGEDGVDIGDVNDDGTGARLGILLNVPGGDSPINLEDILSIAFYDPDDDSITFQTDFMVGQHLSLELPFSFGFGVGDLSLNELMPGFGFEVEDGSMVTIDLSWELRFGFGLDTTEGLYLNASQYENIAHNDIYYVVGESEPPDDRGDPVPELQLSIEGGIPGLVVDASLGLMQTQISDGTVIETSLTGGGMDLGVLTQGGMFEIQTIDEDGNVESTVVTLSDDFDGLDIGPLDLISDAAALMPVIASLNLQLIPLGLTASILIGDLGDEDGYLQLKLTARDPSVERISIVGTPTGFGLEAGMVEDQRAIGLGFDFEQAPNELNIVTAGFALPEVGSFGDDVEMILKLVVDGKEVEVEFGVGVDALNNKAEIDGFDLQVLLNLRLQGALRDAGAGQFAVTLAIVDGHVTLTGAEGVDFGGVVWDRMEESLVSISMNLDLVDPDDEGMLNLVELFSDPLGTLVPELALVGEARLHVISNSNHITDSIGSALGLEGLSLPQVEFDFEMDASVTWSPGDDSPEYELGNPHFANVQVSAGELLTNLVAPALKSIETVLGPLMDILGGPFDGVTDYLNKPIPGISDIASLLGVADDIDWLDLTGNKASFNLFIDSLQALKALIDGIGDLDFTNPIVLNLGCWVVDLDKGSKLPIPCAVEEATAGMDGSVKDVLELLGINYESTGKIEFVPGGFKLDMLEVGNVLNMILGETFDIFSFNLPSLELDLSGTFGFDWDVLAFNIGAGLTVDAGLSFVYDSTGFERIQEAKDAGLEPDYADLLDGFYVRTIDGPELEVHGWFHGSGGVNIEVPLTGFTIFGVNASLDGSLTIGLDLIDPNEDGALRLDEILDVTDNFNEPENLFWLFDATVAGHFGFSMSGTVLGVTLDLNDVIPGLTNINVSLSSQDLFGGIFGERPDSLKPRLAEIIEGEGGANVLRINAGEFAYARIHGDTDDTGGVSDWKVWSVGNKIYVTDGYTTLDFAAIDVDAIVFRGTDEADSIDFSDLKLDLMVDARGGLGNDTITGGAGNDLLVGGGGVDTLHGGDGDDTLYGDEGNDLLYGDGGNDVMFGGAGDDLLAGGLGADQYLFGTDGDYHADTVLENEDLSFEEGRRLDIVSVSDSNGWVNGTGLFTSGGNSFDISNIQAVSGDIQITSFAHGLSDGAEVVISGVDGMGDVVDGTFKIDVLSNNRFILEVLDAPDAGAIQLRIDGHGLTGGESISVTGIAGVPGANGQFTVSYVDENTIELIGTTYSGVFEGEFDSFAFLVMGPGADASELDLLTDTLDFSALRFSQALNVTVAATGTLVTINSEAETGSVNSVSVVSGTVDDYWGSNQVETILGGRGEDDYFVSASPAHFIKLDGQEGSDDYYIELDPELLEGDILIQDTGVRVATDRLFVDGTEENDTFGFTNEEIFFAPDKSIKYSPGGAESGLELIRIDMKDGDDVANVESTPENIVVQFLGQAGSDQFNMGVLVNQLSAPFTPHNLNGIAGTPEPEGGGPIQIFGFDDEIEESVYSMDVDQIVFYDESDTENNMDGVLDRDLLTGLGMGAGVFYLDMETVDIRLGTADDMLTIVGTDIGANTRVQGGSGDDWIIATVLSGLDGNLAIFGDAAAIHAGLALTSGNDALDVRGSSLGVILSGGGGNDEIFGGNGADVIGGGAGNDTIMAGAGADFVYGDSSLDYGESPLDYGESPPPPDVEFVDWVLRVVTEGVLVADNMETPGNDTIDGGEGDDIIFGDHGLILTANGGVEDGIALMDGAVLRVETVREDIGGDDTLHGDEGNDMLFGGQNATENTDYIYGDEGDDILFGDAGVVHRADNTPDANDIYTRSVDFGGADFMSGGGGNDIMLGGRGADDMAGDAQNDLMFGDFGYITRDGDDVVLRAKTIDPTEGDADVMVGDDGDDTMFGGAAADVLDGGAGNDILLGDAGASVRADGSSDANDVFSTDFGTGAGDTGAGDTIMGGSGDDLIIGGDGADDIDGGDGHDIVFGDQALFVRNAADEIEQAAVPELSELDGMADLIVGGSGNDILVGGTGADDVSGNGGNDLIFGDHAQIDRDGGNAMDLNSLPAPNFEFTSVHTGAGEGADADTLSGNDGDDIILGQQGGDMISGGAGDDDIIGGHQLAGGFDGDDVIDGGSGHDVIAGDNAQILRSNAFVAAGLLANRTGVLNQSLTAATLYNLDSSANNAGDTNPHPNGSDERYVTLLDHDATTSTDLYGDDTIAGGADDDIIFGQRGDDRIQGDSLSSHDIGSLVDPVASLENVTDGDDYIEGGSGSDLVMGNLGQDDIIGGSSNLFGLNDASQREDGADHLFGGSATRIGINDPGATDDGDEIALADANGRDADFILGDNGIIIRPVENGEFLGFNYDNYGGVSIVPRLHIALDYTVGGDAADIGAGDLIRGESGDDIIHGMTGDDALYGDGENDDLYGEHGNDWISGGTGQDGILGDDGLILTSRNSTDYGEGLYGIDAVDAVDEVISSRGRNGLMSTIHLDGELKKSVVLFDFGQHPDGAAVNDIIFGGLGGDWLHGGDGNDAISGAEALPYYYGGAGNDTLNMLTGAPAVADPDKPFWYEFAGFNPGDVLRFNDDTGEFAEYDENDPLREVLYNEDPTTPFLLNFDPTSGPLDTRFGEDLATDGDDRIFGDLGHDWLVGGTGLDNMYGGYGNDLLNADDDHTTTADSDDPHANNEPDPFESYADTAFGGAGRDRLIGNNFDDGLIDWVGEFNSYIVPFNPFGASHIFRDLRPQLGDYLLDLAAADGADFTRTEPDGEIGLVTPSDPDWGDQIGPPDDPQPNSDSGPKVLQVKETSGQSTDLIFDELTGAFMAQSDSAELQILNKVSKWQAIREAA